MKTLYYLGLAKLSELYASELRVSRSLQREKEALDIFNKDINLAKHIISDLENKLEKREEEFLSSKKEALTAKMELTNLQVSYEALLRRIK